jgi:imidazolonepropionase-like amidohydrolase
MRIVTGILLATLFFMASFNVIAEDFLIKNATVHTASKQGVLSNTDIYVSDGFIMQVAKNISLTGKHTVIEANGKHVTPGLINASTQLGLVEIGAASSTVDYSTKNEQQGASFNIAPAINFRSTLMPQNRINGLTRAIVRPAGGTSIFHGQGAAIALLSSQQGLISEQVAQYASYGIAGANISGGSRASAYFVLDKALEEANYLRHNRSQYKPGFDWRFSQSLQDLDALKAVLEKKIPLVISVHRSDDILQMIKLAKKHSVRLILAGASEAWVVANEIARAKIPVIMDPILNLPGSFESLANRLDAAAILNEAGVKLVFTGIDWQSTHNGYLVRQSAGNAVSYGMPAEEAIKAMTINTAEVFGIENYGQIKVGMEADIVIWDGEPLELTTNADAVLIKGINQPMVSRATRLRDRYWDLKDIQSKAFTR